ncbi:Heat shock factor protein [Nymphon striatum]|nr:Heat shock factor protein [Nymphon striatum]
MENVTPAFLMKLKKMVDDPSCDHLISWNENGKSFIIHNVTEFSQDMLPYYYKHNNYSSFVRQLNMYGFRKALDISQGNLKSNANTVEFYHQLFVQNEDDCLKLIKRKVPSSKNEIARVPSRIVDENFMEEFNFMKTKYKEFKNILTKRDNESRALWRELATLKHENGALKENLNKLFRFLAAYVPATAKNLNVNKSLKRKFPLMIENSSQENESERILVDPYIEDDSIVPTCSPQRASICEITHSSSPTSSPKKISSPVTLNENASISKLLIPETILKEPILQDGTHLTTENIQPLDLLSSEPSLFLSLDDCDSAALEKDFLGINFDNQVENVESNHKTPEFEMNSILPEDVLSSTDLDSLTNNDERSVALPDVPYLSIPDGDSEMHDFLKFNVPHGINLESYNFSNLFPQDNSRSINTLWDDLSTTVSIPGNELVPFHPEDSDYYFNDLISPISVDDESVTLNTPQVGEMETPNFNSTTPVKIIK